ncbi:MAG TPA: hypothetical protein VIK27_02115 [Candidatus Aquilonibacter sp.]
MIAVIFEVWTEDASRNDYLDIAAALRPLVDEIEGLISIERFASLAEPNKLAVLARAYHPGAHAAAALAYTQLPLAFPGSERTPIFAANGIHYANTAAIHARAIFEHAVDG